MTEPRHPDSPGDNERADIVVLGQLSDDAGASGGENETARGLSGPVTEPRHTDSPGDNERADIVVLGRMSDAAGLAAGLATLLSSGVIPGRCWGSGAGGAPLALATFLGTGPQHLVSLGELLATRPPLTARLRRWIRGSTLDDRWIDTVLTPWFQSVGEIDGFDELSVEDVNRFDDDGDLVRPADWLQLVVLDLEIRRPVLLPSQLDQLGGRYSQDFRLIELLAFAMAGLHGTPTQHVEDQHGHRHELTQYPGFRIPWSLESERRSWPVFVIMPDETSRSSSRWWGTPIDEMLSPSPPTDWHIVEVPADGDAAAKLTSNVLQSRPPSRLINGHDRSVPISETS